MGRVRWCGDACVEDYKSRHDWAYIRGMVFKRDGGVCRECGLDTQKLARVFGWVERFGGVVQAWHIMREMGLEMGWWDCDHVQPREAGGDNSLDNLQTLCIGCHKEKTKAQAAVRAARGQVA